MHVSLVIPALNEAECLPTLLAEIPVGVVEQVIVVDNGSTDATAETAQKCGAQVVAEPRRGYGFACAAGVAAAEGDVLAFMDGDGSFNPAELPALLAVLADDRANLALGSRQLHAANRVAMPPHQRLGNQLFVALLRLRFGLALTDLGPFRAIRRDLLLDLNMQECTFGWPLEMIVKTARRGQRIAEIPVSYRPRFAGQSKVSGTLRGTVFTAYRFTRVMFRYAF